MNVLQSVKWGIVTPPAAIIDNAAATTTAIDTLGYDKIVILPIFGAMDIAVTVLKVQESDDSGMSGAVDITGLIGGTTVDPDTGIASVLPTSTSDNKLYGFFASLQGRKRYLDLSATLGDGVAGTYFGALYALYNGEQTPTTAALRGLEWNLIV